MLLYPDMSLFKKMLACLLFWIDCIVNAICKHENLASKVSISWSNNKMGKVASVSLLPWITCPARCRNTCGKKCYAAKLCRLRETVRNAYARNTAIAIHAPKAFFRAVNNTMKQICFFRFHVSGDILNKKYFRRVVDVCMKNKHCQVLMFTKKYEIVNEFINKYGKLPDNLHIMFSGWTNLKPVNPYNLPETQVYETEKDCKPDWIKCGGNCLNCALHNTGCWVAKQGETIAFKIH